MLQDREIPTERSTMVFLKAENIPRQDTKFHTFFVPFSLAADWETDIFSCSCFSARTQASNLSPSFSTARDIKQKLLVENKQTVHCLVERNEKLTKKVKLESDTSRQNLCWNKPVLAHSSGPPPKNDAAQGTIS